MQIVKIQDSKDNDLVNLMMDTGSLLPTENGTLNSIYFDNGGTTPPFKSVIDELEKYTPWYKYVSDKSIKAKFISQLYEDSRVSLKNFLNADMDTNTVIYTKNTTEAINILSKVISQEETYIRPVVITTYMEHLSDYLPWKYRCDTVLVDVEPDGRLSMDDLEQKLYQYRGRVRLVAVAGASNVTGYVNPIHEIARLAHKYNAQILVDAAQLIQHLPINMNPPDAMARIDFLAFSAHKTYAPFFTGALIGNKKVLDHGLPLCFGAGIADLVTESEIILKKSPDRYEGGSNNLLGAIALATAIQTMIRTGMNVIAQHEAQLLSYAIKHIQQNHKVILYGDNQYLKDRVPIFAFNVKDKNHEEVAKYLYDDYGIIVKNGLCGADLYVQKLVEGSPYTGVVRVSMGLYNQEFEIDRLIKALDNYK